MVAQLARATVPDSTCGSAVPSLGSLARGAGPHLTVWVTLYGVCAGRHLAGSATNKYARS